ncbi:MAG: hypothetical protein WC860_08355 [Candidatus Margulisiibacteriota bacterium]|jgi:hypothetical protein
MDLNCIKKSNLTESISELYDNKLSISEAETAKSYLINFFQILEKVDARINNPAKK